MRLKQIRSLGRQKIDLNCIFSQFRNKEAKEIDGEDRIFFLKQLCCGNDLKLRL